MPPKGTWPCLLSSKKSGELNEPRAAEGSSPTCQGMMRPMERAHLQAMK